MQLKEIMTRNVKAVRPNATLTEAANIMLAEDVGSLPVYDDAKIVGIVTDRDITVRGTAKGLDPKQTRVSEVMTRDIHTCPAGYDVKEASKLMEDKQIRRLVVMDTDNRPIGIVSLGDLALRVSDEDLSGETLREISRPV
ncbi:MAG: CBS domain-containing protein [Burkholderiales bacterium]